MVDRAERVADVKARLVPRPDMSWAAALELVGAGRTERKIAAWLEAQPRRAGVDLAATASIQLAVSQEEAAAILRRWGDRRR